ncbi:hypothetical protein QJS04_geneDACA016225 [Acorus gramineus]|uniref:Aminotransferase-like plant mobile domain-containing protein n=1 Tax=Acorus gramineus TaxID=55184 RepID=A0AAV9AGP9_ACOGR|nr:hypothetical protein QJS04_geneDACA016225 [Acorus gramineus]
MDHWNNLKSWKLNNRVCDRIEGSGFHQFLNVKFRVRHIVENYNVAADVLFITGLPIDGKPVTGSDGEPSAICMKYLGFNGCKEKSGTIDFQWLKDKFQDVPYDVGSVVLPDKSGIKVSVIYLPLLEDIDGIKEYAWGAALLAHLHITLEDCKINWSKSVCGHTYSLLIFVVERISKLASKVFDDVDSLPSQFPLLVGWTDVLCRSSKNNYKKTQIEGSRIGGGRQFILTFPKSFVRPKEAVKEHSKLSREVGLDQETKSLIGLKRGEVKTHERSKSNLKKYRLEKPFYEGHSQKSLVI